MCLGKDVFLFDDHLGSGFVINNDDSAFHRLKANVANASRVILQFQGDVTLLELHKSAKFLTRGWKLTGI